MGGGGGREREGGGVGGCVPQLLVSMVSQTADHWRYSPIQ